MNSQVLIFPDPNEPYVLFTDASKQRWSEVLSQEHITTMNGKNTPSCLPVMYVGGTLVGSQKNLATDKRSLCYIHDIQETLILFLQCKGKQKM